MADRFKSSSSTSIPPTTERINVLQKGKRRDFSRWNCLWRCVSPFFWRKCRCSTRKHWIGLCQISNPSECSLPIIWRNGASFRFSWVTSSDLIKTKISKRVFSFQWSRHLHGRKRQTYSFVCWNGLVIDGQSCSLKNSILNASSLSYSPRSRSCLEYVF